MQLTDDVKQHIQDMWQRPYGKPNDEIHEIPDDLLEAVEVAAKHIRKLYQKQPVNAADVLETVILGAMAQVVASRDRRIGHLKRSVIRHATQRRRCQPRRRLRMVRLPGGC